MTAVRLWLVLGAMFPFVGATQAQTVHLSEPIREGDCFEVRLEMNLIGKLKVHKEGAITPIPLQAQAHHNYPERVLAVSKEGLIEKSARVYAEAKASFRVGSTQNQRTLRKDRTLMVAQRHEEERLIYSPAGSLTREELDLSGYHLDTLFLPGLLANKEVKVGDTWEVPPYVLQAMGNFEGVTECKLVGKLDQLTEKTASFSVTGTASGIDAGALTKLTVSAQGEYDRGSRCLVSLKWEQKDDRHQGPVSPASEVTATTRVERRRIDQPETLSDVALVSVPQGFEPPNAMVALEYHDSKNRFALNFERDWRLVGQTASHTILRLMDRGTFIAQATIAPWDRAEPGKHLSPDSFIAATQKDSGWVPAEEPLQTGEVPTVEKRWIFRYSTLGQLDGVDVMRNFYLVAAPSGEQVMVTVTLTPKHAEKLGARDLALVSSLEVPLSSE